MVPSPDRGGEEGLVSWDSFRIPTDHGKIGFRILLLHRLNDTRKTVRETEEIEVNGVDLYSSHLVFREVEVVSPDTP